MKLFFRIVFILAGLFLSYGTASAQNKDFVLVGESGACPVILASNVQDPVPAAAAMLTEDVALVSGVQPVIRSGMNDLKKYENCVLAGVLGVDPAFDRFLKRHKIKAASLKGAWESYHLQVLNAGKQKILLVLGSDSRGAAYGLLEISRQIGVSPWVWWADATPEIKTTLTFPAGFIKQDKPSVQYRGIFLNDEDFALMPWATETFEPQSAKGAIGPKTYEKICQLLLRLRANLLWPAMHQCTVPFYQVPGNAEVAKKYGIVVGTSHCEPLMRNNTGEWDEKTMGEYDYSVNADNVQKYWKERVKETAFSPCIYTVGMRGIHDGKMQGAESLTDQKALLDKVFKDQRQILSDVIRKPLKDIPQVFIPYKEVLEVYDAGLQVPDDVTLMWCDDNYGHINRLSSPGEQKRSGGSGVYYHLSYWGRPHDYLWLATTSPAQIQFEMTRAWEQNARKIWVANVGDIKPGEYLTEYFLDLAWNAGKEQPIVASKDEPKYADHLQQFMQREFGLKYAVRLSRIMQTYYHLANIRKPEHMGWTRVEENAFPKGFTPLKDTEFNKQEAEARIQAYADIEKQVRYINETLSGTARTTFIQLVFYQVAGASMLNQKILYAQLARQAEAQGLLTDAASYAAASLYAYKEIQNLTKTYNESIAKGKWNKMMNDHPRNLYVFGEPQLPQRLKTVTPKSILHTSVLLRSMVTNASLPEETDLQVSFPASIAQPESRPSGLGHSLSAIRLKKGQTLNYTFTTTSGGNAELRIYTLPNYAVDGGPLRYELIFNESNPIRVNTQTESRSEVWKLQVLRNQAVTKIMFNKLTPGLQMLRITALDDDVILDQIMLDFDANRSGYLVPCTVVGQ
jgi:hypothetical protein